MDLFVGFFSRMFALFVDAVDVFKVSFILSSNLGGSFGHLEFFLLPKCFDLNKCWSLWNSEKLSWGKITAAITHGFPGSHPAVGEAKSGGGRSGRRRVEHRRNRWRWWCGSWAAREATEDATRLTIFWGGGVFDGTRTVGKKRRRKWKAARGGR